MQRKNHRALGLGFLVSVLVATGFLAYVFFTAPSSGRALRAEPLFEQMRTALGSRIQSEIIQPDSRLTKPTPASAELVITPMPLLEALAMTTEQPAFAQWTELDSCSLATEWCATRVTSAGNTLLATWSRKDPSLADGQTSLIFTISVN